MDKLVAGGVNGSKGGHPKMHGAEPSPVRWARRTVFVKVMTSSDG